MLNNLMTGLALMASAESFIAIFLGLLAGIIIGAIPGLTADIAIILCLPITYSMEPIPAMLLLLGLYCGGTYGGSITAILINTPGTPSSAATVLDGYPLTQQGKPLKALTMALYASFFGGLFSALVLLLLHRALHISHRCLALRSISASQCLACLLLQASRTAISSRVCSAA